MSRGPWPRWRAGWRSLHPATAVEAAEAGELVLLAVPFGRYCELPAGLLTGKPVVDATNYRPRVDGPYPELDLDWTTSSELIRAQLRGAKVIKAFNTMRADQVRDYGHEAGALERYGMPLAGDDDLAKRRVEELIEQFGFDPVDTGDLANGGRRMQPGGVAYGVVLPGSSCAAGSGRRSTTAGYGRRWFRPVPGAADRPVEAPGVRRRSGVVRSPQRRSPGTSPRRSAPPRRRRRSRRRGCRW